MAAKDVLMKLAEKAPEEIQMMLELVIQVMPDSQAEAMLTDLRVVGSQLENGHTDQAVEYVNKAYGEAGATMLRQMIDSQASGEASPPSLRELIPSGNAGDTSFIEQLLTPRGRS